MQKKPKFNPEITWVELNPEQAVLQCACYDEGWDVCYQHGIGYVWVESADDYLCSSEVKRKGYIEAAPGGVDGEETGVSVS